MPIKGSHNSERQRKEIDPMGPHWEEEQIKGFRDPQVYLWGFDMRAKCPNRGQEAGLRSGQGMVPSITVWAIVSPARWSDIIRTLNLFPETLFTDVTDRRLSLFILSA